MQPETLFQVSCFLLNVLNGSEPPRGISRVHILYTLTKQAKDLGVHQFTKEVYKDLQQLRVPPTWRDKIELDMLSINKPHLKNKQELAPVCYLCGRTNHYLNHRPATHHQSGDACKFCGHRFIRSFLNFEVLPLVEFKPEAKISNQEALTLIRSSSKSLLMGTNNNLKNRTNKQFEEKHKVNSENSSTLQNGEEEDDSGFTTCINETLEEVAHEARNGKTISRVVIGERILLRIRRQEVFYLPSPDHHNSTSSCGSFFKNMMPDVPLAVSQPCRRFFHEEDLEYSYVSEGKTPISRIPNLGDYGTV
eukprot:189811_1